jgi:Mor family transcriptional regulator
MDWFQSITIDEIPSIKMRDIAQRNGISDAISLMSHLPGIRIYVPVYGSKKEHFEYVKQHFDGNNLMSVSVHLKVNTTRVKYLHKAKGYTRDVLSNAYITMVSSQCGFEVAQRLLLNFFGDYIYIPIHGFSVVRRRMIIKDFSGSNSADVALKYGVSERYVNQIISEHYASSQAVQCDLFS